MKIRNSEILQPFFFLFFFTLACERTFIKTHSTESKCVNGPENILFAGGASVHPSARKENLQAGASFFLLLFYSFFCDFFIILFLLFFFFFYFYLIFFFLNIILLAAGV